MLKRAVKKILIVPIRFILKKLNLDIVRISEKIPENKFKDTTLTKYENYSCETYKADEFSDKDKELLSRFDSFIENNIRLAEYKDSMYRLYYSKKWELGKGVLYATEMFYQSFEKLQIEGQRPTTFRFYAYGLDKLLKKEHNVLDIGCNCGFLALHISEYVNCVDGIEFNKELVDIANTTKDYLNINNCYFYHADFKQFNFDKKYDVIFSFAVHYWIGMTMTEYSLLLSELLNKNGIVIFESQDIDTIDEDFEEKIKEFCGDRFKVIYNGKMMTDKDYPRMFKILLKYP
jgi:protein-L-isoaspartate O-methyltransferase